MIEQIPHLPVTGGRFKNPPRFVHVTVIPCEVIQHDRHRCERHPALVGGHEPEHLGGFAPMLRQGPRRLRLFEKDRDAVFRRDHSRARKPAVQPHPLIQTQGVACIQSPGPSPLAPERPARCAGPGKPGADLHRPRLLPLARCTPCECKLRLCVCDILPHLQANAPRTPFPRIGLVVRMSRHADHTSQQIPAPAREIVLHHIMTLLFGGRPPVVAREARGLHQVLERFKFPPIDIPPPRFVMRQVVEVIAPLSQLHRREHTRPVHRFKRPGIRRTHHAAAPLDLHVAASGIANHRPPDACQVVEHWLRIRCRRRPRVEPVSKPLPAHHPDQFLQRPEIGWNSIKRENKRRMTRKWNHLERVRQCPGEINRPGHRSRDKDGKHQRQQQPTFPADREAGLCAMPMINALRG